MINWPWSKKKDPPAFPKTSVQPPENFMKQFAEGKGNCAWLIPYEYVNWAYEYLGRDDRVYEYGEVLNGHILYLTYACIQYVEDNPE